ncbi:MULTISPECIES: hypothetical protein [unclassified Streptosporangium]|uniref:hypothetical protein n=1 Tax=unclassified Streptosporangium TaxID=2632669 RepID=UPI002E2C9FCF|nr:MULTISPECIES: hypothetical protein [unclassified Streptosporangium]
MAHIHSTPTHLVVQLQGLRQMFGRWRPLTIPWTHVKGASIDERVARSFPGVRWGVSSHIPGVITLGSFRRDRHRHFWDVRDPRKAVIIELTDEKYDRLILEVTDPIAAAAAINERRLSLG